MQPLRAEYDERITVAGYCVRYGIESNSVKHVRTIGGEHAHKTKKLKQNLKF